MHFIKKDPSFYMHTDLKYRKYILYIVYGCSVVYTVPKKKAVDFYANCCLGFYRRW